MIPNSPTLPVIGPQQEGGLFHLLQPCCSSQQSQLSLSRKKLQVFPDLTFVSYWLFGLCIPLPAGLEYEVAVRDTQYSNSTKITKGMS